MVKFQVQTATGRRIELELEPNATIGSLKEEIAQREGFEAVQQRILFEGRQLTDDTTLEVARIREGTILHMVLNIQAG
jgi:ubiquitin-like protein Nedd8